MTTRDIRKLPPDLDKKISRDFNRLIKDIHAKLSTKKRSPVYTGFFASSWKAQTMGVRAKDDVYKFQPWANLAREGKKKKPTPKIQPRFKVDKTFNYKRSVFIGNRAKYAAYALEGGKVQYFIQGELGKLIKETMKEGKLFIASRQTRGLSDEGTGGQAYTEF